MDYILVLVATMFLAGEFAFSKKYQNLEGTEVIAGLRFNALAGSISAIVMFAAQGFRPEFSWISLALAFSMSACCMAYSIIGFRVLKTGGMALYSTFLMGGGMLLPYLFGVIFLEEVLTAPRIIGMILVLAAVVMTNFRKEKIDGKLLLLCVAVFVLNGGVSIISKCHQVCTAPVVSSSAFVMYTGLGRVLFSGAALLICCKKGNKPMKAISAGAVAGAAIIGAASYFLQLIGAKNLPASVLYPMVTGGGIIFSALSGKLFFKEKLSATQIVSIVICFIGTLLFL